MGQDFLDKQYVLCGQYVKVDNLIDPQGPGVGAHQLFPQFDETFLIVGILAGKSNIRYYFHEYENNIS